VACAKCHENPRMAARYGLPPEVIKSFEDSYHGWALRHGGKIAATCEDCHNTHAIGSLADPTSSIHPDRVVATCGRCHAGPFVGFQSSQHFKLLGAGDDRVPTCTTCHHAVGSERPSPRALEATCQQCHGPNSAAPRVERAEAARTLLEEVRDSRELLEAARPFIDRISSKTRQTQLRDAYRQAEVPLIEAGESIHEFVFDNLKERLTTARKRIEALLTELANP